MESGRGLLLTSSLAQRLYLEYAKDMPIFDYHSHVSAKDIYEDRHYSDISELWLGGDHYKWRLMRLCGVDEEYITGERTGKEKFLKFCEILPLCVGNPVYTWCHAELKKYFGFDGVLNCDTAESVWDLCKKKLSEEDFGVRRIIEESGVRFIGTTDDPCDDLLFHKRLSEEKTNFKVLPTFRPDAYINLRSDDFAKNIERLSYCSCVAIDGIKTLKHALKKRMDYFTSCGCICADHGISSIKFEEFDDVVMDRILKKVLLGGSVSDMEAEIFLCGMLIFCMEQYGKLGWVMQIHYNCIRNPNSRALKEIGKDTGFDCIGRAAASEDICKLLDMGAKHAMPKIILYSLNEEENTFLDVLAGSFANGRPSGCIMHGASWWFNDTKEGILRHLESFASHGVLGNFIGMLTDSRSFLSYVRHDYFRRILCSFVSEKILSGEYVATEDDVGRIIRRICYGNAVEFFGMEGKI